MIQINESWFFFVVLLLELVISLWLIKSEAKQEVKQKDKKY